MSLIKRLTITAAAAALAGPLLMVPAAHAAGTYTCDSGTFFERGPAGGTPIWHVWGNPCTGSGDGGASVITISSGSSAGTYECDRANLLTSTWVSGSGCVKL
ncbi:hypothetical protein [Streptosporangium sp. NPDC000239]|uniref:Ig-like domain-containing protein n=1 Tax=Streptosporangium jomthongense TaxID=1193683 RepID=A0ABV8EWK6_9ACTN